MTHVLARLLPEAIELQTRPTSSIMPGSPFLRGPRWSQVNSRVDKGIYDCDCNGFVGFVLKNAAPAHFELVPKETTQSRPRAFKYYGFFASLTPETPGGWHRIDFLKDARRGDIIAWRVPRIEKDVNTGHVVFVAETATVDESGVFSV
jgi:hypothetical protein